jgi:hypothetical protein
MSAPSRSVREIVLESLLIVFSVLFALAVNQWMDARKEARLSARVLDNIKRELQENRASITSVLSYHEQLLKDLGRVDSLHSVRSLADLRKEIPEFTGFHNPALLGTGWRNALAVGAVQGMGFDTISAISKAYYRQEKLEEYVGASLPGFDFSDAAMTGTVRKSSVFVETLYKNEEALLQEYKAVLELLK